jgi:4-hydroxybenzoate polyprenyltransferase
MTLAVALRLGRVSNLPTVWTNVLAACAVAGASFAPPATLALALAMSLFYVGGMYLNDAFDREIDARERPERPIPSGAVSARSVFGVGFALLASGLALVAALALELGAGADAIAAGALLGAAIVAYDVWHKRTPWSPVLMGACRALVYLTAGALAGDRLQGELFWAAALLLGYVVGLSFAARQENLARIESAWPLALLAAPLGYAALVIDGAPLQHACFAGLCAWIAWALWRLMGPQPDLRGGVSLLIAGIPLLDALFAALAHAPAIALLCAAGAPLTWTAQRRIAGT